MSPPSDPHSSARSSRFAILGCGRMGRLHCERLQADGRGQVVALHDVDPSAAEILQKSLATGATLFGQFDKLVETARPDAVVVCTPTQLHFEQVLSLLSRCIPVLCEKPLARTRSEIVKLIETARQSHTLLSVAYQRRMWATYRTMRQLVQSGELGAVRAVMSHNLENWQQTIAATWRDDPQANPGGFIGDAGSHKIDVIFYVTGLAPREVFARCDRWGSRVETMASVSGLLEGGVPVTMDFIGNAQHFSEILAIHCAKGDLTLREGEIWLGRDGRSERIAINQPDCNPIVAFLDALRGRAENFAPPECALPVFDFTQAILESAKRGETVAIGATPS